MDVQDYDWDAEARSAAEVASQGEVAEIERGVLPWDSPGICVVFGNDGYCDNLRCRAEVNGLWSLLEHSRVEVLGFGINREGQTWAMLVRHTDYRWLTDVTWTAWQHAKSTTPWDQRRPKPK